MTYPSHGLTASLHYKLRVSSSPRTRHNCQRLCTPILGLGALPGSHSGSQMPRWQVRGRKRREHRNSRPLSPGDGQCVCVCGCGVWGGACAPQTCRCTTIGPAVEHVLHDTVVSHRASCRYHMRSSVLSGPRAPLVSPVSGLSLIAHPSSLIARSQPLVSAVPPTAPAGSVRVVR